MQIDAKQNFKTQCHTVTEPNMALSATRISSPLTINLSLPLPPHLKYKVSYSIVPKTNQ